MNLTFIAGRCFASLALLGASVGGVWAAPASQYVYKESADRDLKMDLTFPAGWREGDARPAIVFFYNGGWKESGSNLQFTPQAQYFAKRGAVVARADYREKDSAGVSSDKCMEDIYSAVRWMRTNAKMLGVDPDRIAAGGGSGSGHLAASVFYVDEVRAPGDDPSISPRLRALLLYNPDLDVLDPAILNRILGGDKVHAAQMPPTLAFYGDQDLSHVLIADFVEKARKRGLPVQAFVGRGGTHGFFKFTPSLENTTRRADEFLQAAGVLGAEPRAVLPSKPEPEGYSKSIQQNMSKWQARHEALMKERQEKGDTQPSPPGVATGAATGENDQKADKSPMRKDAAEKAVDAAKPEATTVSSGSVQTETRVYKTIGERKLIVEIGYPEGWTTNGKRPAAVIFHGNANSPKDKGGNPYPMAEERTRLGMPVAQSSVGEAFKPLARYLAQRGMVAIRCDFRSRSKDGVMPDKCIEDAISAMRWVRKNAPALGIDPERIAAIGGSGGGFLAAACATIDEFQSPGDDRSVSPKPNVMVLHYPLIDWLAEGSMSEAFLEALNGDRDLAARLSPARHWSKNLPPTLILIGTRDPQYESEKAFVARWKKEGANIDIYVGEDGNHGFSQYSPWLEKTTERTDEFLRAVGYLKNEPRVELPHRDKAEKLARKAPAAKTQEEE